MLHAFRALPVAYIVAQVVPDIRSYLLTSASPFRYPPPDAGSATFVNFHKVSQAVLSAIKYHSMTGPALLMATALNTAAEQVAAAVETSPVSPPTG